MKSESLRMKPRISTGRHGSDSDSGIPHPCSSVLCLLAPLRVTRAYCLHSVISNLPSGFAFFIRPGHRLRFRVGRSHADLSVNRGGRRCTSLLNLRPGPENPVVVPNHPITALDNWRLWAELIRHAHAGGGNAARRALRAESGGGLGFLCSRSKTVAGPIPRQFTGIQPRTLGYRYDPTKSSVRSHLFNSPNVPISPEARSRCRARVGRGTEWTGCVQRVT